MSATKNCPPFHNFTKLLLCALILIGCGGTVGGLVQIAGITLSVSRMTLPSDGFSSTIITATVLDSAGKGAPIGTIVHFTTDLGRFANGYQNHSLTTGDTSGVVSTALIAGNASGVARIQALADGISQSVNIIIGIQVGSITLTADPMTLPADGSSSTNITATVLDSSGSGVPIGTKVRFSTNLGRLANGLQNQTLTTVDISGAVSTALIAGNTSGIARVQASADGISQSIDIIIGTEVGAITLTADPMTISADGSSASTITAVLKDSVGNALPFGTPATFTTTLGRFNNGLQALATTVTGDDGTILTALIAGESPGTARVSCRSGGMSASIIIFIEEPAVEPEDPPADPEDPPTVPIASISVSGVFHEISIRTGTNHLAPGFQDLHQSTWVEAIAVDEPGNPVAGIPILFDIPIASGYGETMIPAIAYTDQNGRSRSEFASGDGPWEGASLVPVNVSFLHQPFHKTETAISVDKKNASVIIGYGDEPVSTGPDQYTLSMSIQVQETDRLPVVSADVRLSSSQFDIHPETVITDGDGLAAFELVYPTSAAGRTRVLISGETQIAGDGLKGTYGFILPGGETPGEIHDGIRVQGLK